MLPLFHWHTCQKEIKIMITSAKNLVQSVTLDPSTFRMPQATDKFKIEIVADNTRQYYLTNQTSKKCYLVTFMVTASGTRTCACTCPDFANIRKHGRQCKHVNVAYHFHVSRMKAAQAASHVKAVDTSVTPAPVKKFSDRHIPDLNYGKITVR